MNYLLNQMCPLPEFLLEFETPVSFFRLFSASYDDNGVLLGEDVDVRDMMSVTSTSLPLPSYVTGSWAFLSTGSRYSCIRELPWLPRLVEEQWDKGRTIS